MIRRSQSGRNVSLKFLTGISYEKSRGRFMGFLAHIREALMNLFSAKIRSLLAVLGILVGTGSVVALISSSQLATEHALSEFKKLGTNLLAVMLANNGPSSNGQQQSFK